MKRVKYGIIFFLAISANSLAQVGNKPERVKWYQDLGFGMFIHWNVDVVLGGVISHSLAGASKKYADRYFAELPQYFNPKDFDPKEWAKLAKLSGMRYVVFTAKHHSGFCMFDTKTTDFNVLKTPFGRDVLKETLAAFRAEGIAVGLYFSPEDFLYLHENNKDVPIGRLQHPMHFPEKNKGLMEYDKKQLKELLTNYGKIDVLFFDGPAEELKEYAWQLQPDVVVTRGEIATPEQTTPDKPLPRPWEACYTMGTEWSYKANNDDFKTGNEVINKLIEIRAKGGNFLLNVGPSPDGTIRREEADNLREVGMWMMANRESIYDVKPLASIRDGGFYLTQSNDEKYVYAYISRQNFRDWNYGERKVFTFPRLISSGSASVLGFGSEIVEYRQNLDAKTYLSQTLFGLVISAVNGQRFYTDNKWPNTVVLKIENAKLKAEENTESRSKLDGAH